MATIAVQHQIKDPETFFGLTGEVTGDNQSGIQALQFCPSEDHSQAVCLWDAPSLDKLRLYLDGFAGPEVTVNAYYVVDEQNAFGLPRQAAASA